MNVRQVDTANFTNKKALLKWKGIEINDKNLKIIKKTEYQSPVGFTNFVSISILYKNRNLEYYRNQYVKKTGNSWETATIKDIYNAELVWGF